MIRTYPRDQETAIIKAFGQTWWFSGHALHALWLAGIDSPLGLKALVIDLTSQKGLEAGQHLVDYSGVRLQISAEPDHVIVNDDLHA